MGLAFDEEEDEGRPLEVIDNIFNRCIQRFVERLHGRWLRLATSSAGAEKEVGTERRRVSLGGESSWRRRVVEERERVGWGG